MGFGCIAFARNFFALYLGLCRHRSFYAFRCCLTSSSVDKYGLTLVYRGGRFTGPEVFCPDFGGQWKSESIIYQAIVCFFVYLVQ